MNFDPYQESQDLRNDPALGLVVQLCPPDAEPLPDGRLTRTTEESIAFGKKRAANRFFVGIGEEFSPRLLAHSQVHARGEVPVGESHPVTSVFKEFARSTKRSRIYVIENASVTFHLSSMPIQARFGTYDGHGVSAGVLVSVRKNVVQAFVAFEYYTKPESWEKIRSHYSREHDFRIGVEAWWQAVEAEWLGDSSSEEGEARRLVWIGGSSLVIWNEVIGRYVSVFARSLRRHPLAFWR